MGEKRRATSADKDATIETTIFRLCRAIVSLKKKQSALWEFFGNQDATIEEIDELEQAVMDLCGVPHEYGAFDPDNEDADYLVRDAWSNELDGFLTPEATEKDFKRMLKRMAEMNRGLLSGGTSLN